MRQQHTVVGTDRTPTDFHKTSDTFTDIRASLWGTGRITLPSWDAPLQGMCRRLGFAKRAARTKINGANGVIYPQANIFEGDEMSDAASGYGD